MRALSSDDVSLKAVKNVRATQCDRAAKRSGCRCSRRCETEKPGSEKADEKGSGEFRESHPEVQEGLDRKREWSDPKVPAEQQWEAEVQSPEDDGACLEQETCLR